MDALGPHLSFVRAGARPGVLRRIGAGARDWLAARHSLYVEVAAVLGLYGTYELARGLAMGNEAEADRHARSVAAIERSTHMFFESDVQRVVHTVPGAIGVLGAAYLTLHLTVTLGVLLWLHRRRPAAFPLARTALLFASALALVGFVLFPTAPPRLAGVGIADTIASERININGGLVSALYNPYAAVPSMHIAYALIVAGSVFALSRRRLVRIAAALYPLTVLLVIIATGNHFFLDAAAGAFVAVLAAAAAFRLLHRAAPRVLVPVAASRQPLLPAERRAA
jgi:hypothetical protein